MQVEGDALRLKSAAFRPLIEARRSVIRVLDRENPKAAAGDSYGVPEREYRHLIGASL